MTPPPDDFPRDPDLSMHGLSINPDRTTVRVESVPPPEAGFTFVREVGRGGMGVVYEAREDATGRQVAVKVIAQRLMKNADAVGRFEREARLAASISHPNCVFVFGAHAVGGATAISMELMTGENLEDRVRTREPIPVETAVQWGMEMLDGLAAAHALGIVHRDVKPSNCFLTADGHVKVGDFGLSRSIDGDLGLTQTGAFLGSPLYASPEQIRGRTLDARTDVYSAGATLYAVLAGRPPHSGQSMGDVLAQIVSEDPPALDTLRPGLPRGLAGVVAKALAKDPAKRFADCAAFRRALLPYAPGSLTPATLGLRIGGYIVDGFVICSVVYQAGCAVLLALGFRFAGTIPGAPWIPTESVLARATPTIFTMLWFATFEALWGATPVRRFMGLRVVRIDGGRASFPRLLLRASVFMAPYALPTVILGLETRPLHSFAWLFVYALSMVTMRKRNAYRGFHEFVSGTRVMRVASSSATRALPPLDPERPKAADMPETIGPYAVEGLVGRTASGPLLVALDPGLNRKVWIHFGASVARPAHDAKGASLHWLRHGDELGGYEVFEAPGGASLTECAAAGRTISWSAALPVLGELIDELRARGDLAIEQLWIDRGGRLRVLDSPIGETAVARPGLEVLASAARLILGGAPAGSFRIPLDLPVHAERPLRRIVGVDPPFESLDAARDALVLCAGTRAVVTRGRRAAQVAVVGVWLVYMAAIVAVALRQADLDRAKEGRGPIGPAFTAFLSLMVLIVLYCGPSLILAFALRGSLTFSMFGIRLRSRSGKRAPRWRCMLRAFVVCLPIAPIGIVAAMRSMASDLLVWVAWGLTAVLYAVAAAFSIARIVEGPADKIARTHIVAR